MTFRNPCAAAACVLNFVLVIGPPTITFAAADVPPGVARLLDEAEIVVVGAADRTESLWKENSRGDKVIVSRTLVRTREGLKGETENAIWVDVEGGSIDGVTLRVSGSTLLNAGDQAVLFLQRNADGIYTLHEHGRGVLKLDDRDVVRGTTIALEDIRQAAASVNARGRR